ncbi:MAG: hypothetical protein PGN08_03010 [Sphingomonas taxi]
MTFAARCAAIAIAAACAAPVAARSGLPEPVPHYQASYKADRGLYCIRQYRTGTSGATRAIGDGLNCRSKANWQRVGLTITHRLPSREQLAQR